MRSNYKALGKYVQPVAGRNNDLGDLPLVGLSIQKKFIPSIANTIGTDMSTYRIIERNQFAYGPVTSRNGDKITVALFNDFERALISQAYIPFAIKDINELDPEYLMMWFRRSEFDRYARFKSHGSAREIFDWEEMCNVMLPVPYIDKQREIVKEYNIIQNRITLNEQLIQKLEAMAQAIYKEWFVDGIDKENLPEGWRIGKLSDIATIIMGQSPEGESYNYNGNGSPLVNGPVEFGEYFTLKSKWTTEPKKFCKKNDLIFCVRGSTTGRHVIADDKYAIGRGVCAIRAKNQIYLMELIKANLTEILKDVTGSTFPNIDRMTLGNYPITIGNDEILGEFESKLSPISQLLWTKSKENHNLTELRDLLLSKLTSIEN